MQILLGTLELWKCYALEGKESVSLSLSRWDKAYNFFITTTGFSKFLKIKFREILFALKCPIGKN